MTEKTTISANAKRIAIRPLALGEATGHHHSLVAEPGINLEDAVEMYEEPDGTVKVRILTEGVSVQHQEHKTHSLIAGTEYRVTIQQEETDWGQRPVQD